MLAMATRANPAVRRAKQLVDSGWLGVPYSATMDWVADQTRLTRENHLFVEVAGSDFRSSGGGGGAAKQLSWQYDREKSPGG